MCVCQVLCGVLVVRCVHVCVSGVEQNMVPWKKDKEEKQCRGCGGNFGIIKRRHHCRLCGGIRCKECCRFMALIETCTCMQRVLPSLTQPLLSPFRSCVE